MKYSSLILTLVVVCSSALYAQENKTTTSAPVPVDPITKMITYEGVVEVKGETAATLYKRALEWFKTNYKNPTDVIRENDEAGNKIVGKHRFKIMNPPDKNGVREGDAGLIEYTITVSSRDGRFKYEITQFSWKQASVYPCERWLQTTEPGYKPAYNDYLIQLDKEILVLISNLKDYMAHAKPVKDKDNW
ncbi:MAG: DUF4468 domain-containing protein [Bacteroidia bacterium]|nr:DUF4468 domain-containing protein [Bacteroidia bacterium]